MTGSNDALRITVPKGRTRIRRDVGRSIEVARRRIARVENEMRELARERDAYTVRAEQADHLASTLNGDLKGRALTSARANRRSAALREERLAERQATMVQLRAHLEAMEPIHAAACGPGEFKPSSNEAADLVEAQQREVAIVYEVAARFADAHGVADMVRPDGVIEVSAARTGTMERDGCLWPSLFDDIAAALNVADAPEDAPADLPRRNPLEQRTFQLLRTPGALHAGEIATAAMEFGNVEPIAPTAREEEQLVSALASPRHSGKLIDAVAYYQLLDTDDASRNEILAALQRIVGGRGEE